MVRILIIDDSRVMRDMLSDFLGDNGFEVAAVEFPDEGMALAWQKPFDLCICDMHLLGTNGLEVVTRFSAEFPDLRCIITDSLPDEHSEKVRSNRAFHYIRKPFELDQLRALIQSALDRTQVS